MHWCCFTWLPSWVTATKDLEPTANQPCWIIDVLDFQSSQSGFESLPMQWVVQFSLPPDRSYLGKWRRALLTPVDWWCSEWWPSVIAIFVQTIWYQKQNHHIAQPRIAQDSSIRKAVKRSRAHVKDYMAPAQPNGSKLKWLLFMCKWKL